MDSTDGRVELMIVSGSDLLDSGFAIQSHSDSFVGLHKLIQLLGQLLVLHSDDSDVVVQGVDLDLKVGVVIEEG